MRPKRIQHAVENYMRETGKRVYSLKELVEAGLGSKGTVAGVCKLSPHIYKVSRGVYALSKARREDATSLKAQVYALLRKHSNITVTELAFKLATSEPRIVRAISSLRSEGESIITTPSYHLERPNGNAKNSSS